MMSSIQTKSKKFVDVETGETVDLTQLLVTKSDFDFDKVWTMQLASILELAGSKPIKILSWLIRERDHQNVVIGTYPKIAEATSTSPESVKRTMKILLDSGVIAKVQNGVYRVNPDLVWRGAHQRRQAILLEYRREGGAEITPLRKEGPKEETEAELRATLQALALQAESLQVKMENLQARLNGDTRKTG
jgi:hypothetical protein